LACQKRKATFGGGSMGVPGFGEFLKPIEITTCGQTMDREFAQFVVDLTVPLDEVIKRFDQLC
jgi:hypothetical protein